MRRCRNFQEEQRRLCQSVVMCFRCGYDFAYFKDPAQLFHIPGNILDKEIIEYHGNRRCARICGLRILPQEEEFHYEEMRLVYRDIYIREKVIFEGETLEYQIEEEETASGRRKKRERFPAGRFRGAAGKAGLRRSMR